MRNKCLTLAKTLKPMRRSSALGWTSMEPSIASWRPLTTKCPDIRKYTYLPQNNHFAQLFFFFCFSFILSLIQQILFLYNSVLYRSPSNIFFLMIFLSHATKIQVVEICLILLSPVTHDKSLPKQLNKLTTYHATACYIVFKLSHNLLL